MFKTILLISFLFLAGCYRVKSIKCTDGINTLYEGANVRISEHKGVYSIWPDNGRVIELTGNCRVDY